MIVDPPDLAVEDKVVSTARFLGLGIAATISGTLLAVDLIPDDPTPSGALFGAALVMTLSLSVAPALAALREPKSLLRTEHILVLSPIYWLLLDLLQGLYPMDRVLPQEATTAFIGIGLFVVAVWIGAYRCTWRIPPGVMSSLSQEVSENTYFRLAVAAFILGMLRFAIPCNFDLTLMFSSIGEGRWSAPWGRGQLGGWDAFLDQLQYFGYLLPMLTVVVAHYSGWRNRRTLIALAMSVVMVLFLLQSGGRRIVGTVVGMSFVLWMLTQQQVRVKQVVINAIMVVSLLFLLEVMREYRNVGLTMFIESEETEPLLEKKAIRVDDNFYRLCQIIELIPEEHSYLYLKYIVWVLVRPIPRVLWPDKPIDPGFDLSEAVGLKQVSLTSSIVGELYMSSGFIGIALGGWFYGRLSGMASQLVTQRATVGMFMTYTLLTMSLFAGMRSMVELVLMNYATVAWIGLSRVFIFFQKNQKSESEI